MLVGVQGRHLLASGTELLLGWWGFCIRLGVFRLFNVLRALYVLGVLRDFRILSDLRILGAIWFLSGVNGLGLLGWLDAGGVVELDATPGKDCKKEECRD